MHQSAPYIPGSSAESKGKLIHTRLPYLETTLSGQVTHHTPHVPVLPVRNRVYMEATLSRVGEIDTASNSQRQTQKAKQNGEKGEHATNEGTRKIPTEKL